MLQAIPNGVDADAVAGRGEHGEQEVPAAETGMVSSSQPLDPQQQIDQLRAQVTRLARRLEEPA